MELLISIGERLREVREELGKTQSDFAAVAAAMAVPGATRQSQAKYEKGQAAPSAAYMAAIATAGADVLYILTGSRDYEPPPVLSPEERVMLDYFRQAPPAVRRAALGALLGATVEGTVQNINAPVLAGGVAGRNINYNHGGKKK